MEIDFTGLHKAMDELAEGIKKVFQHIFNKSKNLIEDIVEVLKKIKYKEKVKYKPVLKIKPNKLYYKDKSLRNYYCRNNC